MKDINKLFIYRKKLIKPYIQRILNSLSAITYVASILFLFVLVYEHGFLLSWEDQALVRTIYQWVWRIFLMNSLAHLALDYTEARLTYKRVTWMVNILLYLTLLPVFFHEPSPTEGVLHGVWWLFQSNLYHVILLLVLSIIQLSHGVVRLLGKRLNPSLIFSTSFFLIILIGAGLLMLPRSTYSGISFIDALFTSTSATCVTGLSTVDVSTTFTPIGHLLIMILIQVGGLGVMTLTSFFAMFFMGGAGVYNQVMMSDMVNSKSLNSLLTTLLYILGFTLIIEAGGALCLFWDIHGTMGMTLNEEIFFAVFHSISAFCNAGFSLLPSNLGSSLLMEGHNPFYLTISWLVILGGIGFPILVNLYETVKYNVRRLYKQYILHQDRIGKQVHQYNINTRIVIAMTTLLLGVSFLLIALLEWNNAFAGMPVVDKCVHAFFNAVSPRTAGFNSVATSSFGVQTILLLIVLMIIGGGTQSTAGGIKVNVFAVVLLNLRAILSGADNVTLYNRELSYDSIRRSNATIILYVVFVFVSLFAISLFEPEASILAITFECVSALSTVGASLDLTSTLGNDSKFVIILLMFVGRVGVLTIMTSIIKQHKKVKYRYPSDNIIIN